MKRVKLKLGIGKSFKRSKLLPLVVLVAGSLAALVWAYQYDHRRHSSTEQKRISGNKCTEIYNETTNLLNNKQYKEAYSKIKAKQNIDCKPVLKAKDVTEEKENTRQKAVGDFLIKGAAARSAYLAGDKEQANKLADEVIGLNQTFTLKSPDEARDQSNLVFDMYKIKSDEALQAEEYAR